MVVLGLDFVCRCLLLVYFVRCVGFACGSLVIVDAYIWDGFSLRFAVGGLG